MRSIALAVSLSIGTLAQVSVAQAERQSSGVEKKEDDPSKFFWFYKAGLDAPTAKIDIQYCFIQTSTIRAAQKPSAGAYGLIGALVSGIINGITEATESRRMRDAGMRKCMGLYEYERYAVPEAEWNAMMRAPDAVDRLVAFATGVRPAEGKLNP